MLNVSCLYNMGMIIPIFNGMLVNRKNQLSREKQVLICIMCQVLWCKSSHHGQFQATNVMPQS